MNNSDILNVVNYFIQKDTTRNIRNIFTPEQAVNIMYSASLQLFKAKVGIPQAYMGNVARIGEAFENSMLNSEALRPFKYVMGDMGNPYLAVSSGVATVPSNMYYPIKLVHLHSTNTGLKEHKIKICTDSEYEDLIDNAIDYPTNEYPIANFQDSLIRIRPNTVRYCKFIYLKHPVKPSFEVVTIRGFIEYDSVNSIELEWHDAEKIDIIYIMLKMVGINIERGDIFQIANEKLNSGK